MKAKIKAMFAAAGAAILAGGAIVASLVLSTQDAGVTCAEWRRTAAISQDPQRRETFYFAVNGAQTPDGCAAGECVATLPGCNAAIRWSYSTGPAVSGWRLARVRAIPAIGGLLKKWASVTAGVRWLSGMGEAIPLCKADMSAADCLALFNADAHCWLLDDGTTCRYGKRGSAPTSSGLNGTACPYGQVVAPLPCVVDRGPGSELRDAAKTWTDGELNMQ